ncbi:MAG: penicillin-binding protein activator [Proteobacteria bacterium]|nr:penicillin-binding protein activator [Pseudomonadota bacterium]
MIRAGFFSVLAACLFSLALASCVTTDGSAIFEDGEATDITASSTTETQGTTPQTPQSRVSAGTLREPVKVAILAPQSGPNAAMGEALIQAAQLAVFDLDEPQFQIVPKDSQGTAEGARRAVDEAAREGVKLILGPLFAKEVETAKAAARSYGLTLIGFSTDWRVAGDNAFTMGVLPFGQVERIAEYASRQGMRRIAAIATSDMYGDAVLSLFQSTAQRYGMSVTKVVRVSPDGRDGAAAVAMLTEGKVLSGSALPYDAVFMPVGGQAAKVVASSLKTYGIGGDRLKLLGTGLWDDPIVLSDPNMAGAVYAAPAPQIRAAFERNYQRIYGTYPPRLASIGYDAAALAIVLARSASSSGQRVTYDRNSLLNPNGFSGVDGIFRFKSNGLVERGLAVLQIAGGKSHLVEGAPSSFVSAAR